MLIKDLETGIVREYGKDCHDSLAISPDGRSLSYYNLQCGEGSRYGCFRFVMEDGKVPDDSQTPDAIHASCYFNIGGFPSVKQIRAEVIDEMLNFINVRMSHLVDLAEEDCRKADTYQEYYHRGGLWELGIVRDKVVKLKEQNK